MHEVALELCSAACLELRVLTICLVSAYTASCVVFICWLSHIVMNSTRRHAEGMPDSYARQIAAGRGSRVRMPWKNIKKMFIVVRKNLMFLWQKNKNQKSSNTLLALNVQIQITIVFGFFFNGFICIRKKIK